MDLGTQRKRRAPVTYGKLFISRRKIPSSFGDGFDALQHGEEDLLMGGGSSSQNRQHSKSSSSKSPETSDRKLPEPQLKQLKSGPVPSRSSKHGLDRANSTSKAEVADQKVFDVPSSGEDVTKLRPIIRRALPNSQKKFRSGRLEENRIPSTGKSERVPSDREEAKASRPMVTLGQAGCKILSTAMGKPANMKDGGKQASKTSVTEKTDVNATTPRKPIQSPALGSSLTGQQLEGMKSSVTPVSSVRTEKRRKARVNSKGRERLKLEDSSKMEEEPPPKGRLNTLTRSKDERGSEIATGIPAVAGVPLVQPRPRKQREPKPIPSKAEQPPQAPAQPSLPKLNKTVARASQNKAPARPPPKSPTGVGSLYISLPVLDTQEPIEVPTEPSVATHSPSEGLSLWDEIMGGIESEDQSIARKPKRSRDSGSSDREMERGPTPPRRRRLIDTLEVDWTVRRPKQRILEAEMDVDSDSGSVDDTPMITLTDSQPCTDSQNTDEVEDAAQAFQRGVGAIQSAPAFPQRNTRVTYARQRSFLTEEVKEGGDPFADPLLLPVRDFGRGLRKAPVVEEEDDEDHGSGMMKSLHELREAGVNKRFLDSVEGYFEDIERGFSIGQKRVGYGFVLLIYLQDYSNDCPDT